MNLKPLEGKDSEQFWVMGPAESSSGGHHEWSYRVYLKEKPNEFTDECFQARFRPFGSTEMISILLFAPTAEFARRGIATALLRVAHTEFQKRIVSSSNFRRVFSDEKRSPDADVFWESLTAKGLARYDSLRDRYEFLPGAG